MIENLWDYGKNKRTLQKLREANELQYKKPREILRIIQHNKWPYRTNQDFYHKRDLALASLLYLSSARVGEVLRLKASQFSIDESDPDFMIIQNFYVSKRKEGKIHPILEIPLPLKGSLAPFTKLVREYLKLLGPEDKLFTFSRHRAWAIIRYITNDPGVEENPGWFCHWFRAQSLSYQVQLIRSTISVSSQRGIENPATLKHYDSGDWRQYKDELKQ